MLSKPNQRGTLTERMAKWNAAPRIEERLGADARLAGMRMFGHNPRPV